MSGDLESLSFVTHGDRVMVLYEGVVTLGEWERTRARIVSEVQDKTRTALSVAEEHVATTNRGVRARMTLRRRDRAE